MPSSTTTASSSPPPTAAAPTTTTPRHHLRRRRRHHRSPGHPHHPHRYRPCRINPRHPRPGQLLRRRRHLLHRHPPPRHRPAHPPPAPPPSTSSLLPANTPIAPSLPERPPTLPAPQSSSPSQPRAAFPTTTALTAIGSTGNYNPHRDRHKHKRSCRALRFALIGRHYLRQRKRLGTAPLVAQSTAFSLSAAIPTTTPSGPGLGMQSFVKADFNKDGKTDLAFTSGYVGGCTKLISILLGKGNGTFTNAPAIKTTFCPETLAIGDFNNDGNTDLAVTDGGGEKVVLYFGDGKGGFTLGTSSSAASPTASSIGDFNGDGNIDLAIASSTGAPSILLGRGDGTFSQAPAASVPGTNLDQIAAGDFNGDGKLDLASHEREWRRHFHGDCPDRCR